jgi:acyl-CoA synthetase (NDP forming)
MAKHPLDVLFHPRSIAFVGVSRTPGRAQGPNFLYGLTKRGFHERKPLYLVNPNASEIEGIRCYPSLADCPAPVDHVICSVPSRLALDLVDQAARKHVRSIHFFTAGFEESGDADQAALERELIARARAAGIRVVGPNCLGLYVPAERISFSPDFPEQSGDVFVISQSGGNALELVSGLGARGVFCSGAVSFGNGRDVAAPELFDYAAQDPSTRVVVAYLEGAGTGRALLEALRRCALVKPTIVLKGGVSEGGAAAAASHTASLAGSAQIFESLCRQVGAMRAESLEEALDLVTGVRTALRGVRGPRAIMLASGGGFSVLAADAVARHGVTLPALSARTQARLRAYVPAAGNSVRNPIDASFLDDREGAWPEIIDIVGQAGRSGESDVVLLTSTLGSPAGKDGEPTDRDREMVARIERVQRRGGVPMVCVERGWNSAPTSRQVQRLAQEHGIAVLPSMERAARTVELLLRWRAQREGLPSIF